LLFCQYLIGLNVLMRDTCRIDFVAYSKNYIVKSTKYKE
jgi:hypothetical protein